MDDLLKKLIKTMKPQWKFAFWGCIIAGFVVHMYPMTHHFLTGDSLWNQYSSQDMISSGRQFLTFACGITSFYDLPWLNGLFTLFYLAVTAIFIVELFGIKSKFYAALTGVLLISFPVVVSTFCYAYTIDGYMLAVLCTTMAVYFAGKNIWGSLLGALLVGFSLGVYQGYYSFSILLCILVLLKDILSDENGRKFLPKAFRYLGMGIGGYVFYVVTLKIMLMIKGMSLSGYQGTDRILAMSFADIPRGIFVAVKTFGSFALKSNVLLGNNYMKIAYFLLVLLGIGMYLFLFVRKKCYKDCLKCVLLLFLTALIPVGTTIACVLAPDTFFHLLMRYPWVLFFVYILVLLEELEKLEIKEAIRKATAVISSLALLVMVFCFMVNGNIAYFNLNEKYEKTYSYALRIADRLEATPGYSVGEKVFITGGIPTEEYFPYTDITYKVLKGYFGPNENILTESADKYQTFFAHYLNVTIEIASWKEAQDILATQEFNEMGRFPDEDSIKKINGIWVIKTNG